MAKLSTQSRLRFRSAWLRAHQLSARITVTIHTTNEIISKIEQKKLFHIEVGIKLEEEERRIRSE